MCSHPTALASLAGFVFAGSAIAQPSLVVTSAGSPASGLDAFIVSADAGVGETLDSFQEITITGNVHQVWGSALGGGFLRETPTIDDTAADGNLWDVNWTALDSHILIAAADVGGGAGGGFGALAETNDESNPAGLVLAAIGLGDPPLIGIGDIDMPAATVDAFFLVPAAQQQVVDLAYLVIPTGGQVSFSVDAAGSFDGIANLNITIPIPEPATAAALGLGLMTLLRRRRRAA